MTVAPAAPINWRATREGPHLTSHVQSWGPWSLVLWTAPAWGPPCHSSQPEVWKVTSAPVAAEAGAASPVLLDAVQDGARRGTGTGTVRSSAGTHTPRHLPRAQRAETALSSAGTGAIREQEQEVWFTVNPRA